MSIDLYACHAVKSATLQGDLDPDAALVLSMLPQSMQESSLRRLRTLPTLITSSQILTSLESVSLPLSKTDFEKSKCKSCLHNTNVANTAIASVGCFKPGLCLFALCAQHRAQDEDLLAKRTLVAESSYAEVDERESQASLLDETSEEEPAPMQDDSEHEFTTDDFDVGEPDTSGDVADSNHSQNDQCDEASSSNEPHAATDELSPVDLSAQITDSYIEKVREGWWRSALRNRVSNQGTHKELLDFLAACLIAGFQKPVTRNASAVEVFLDIASANPEDYLARASAELIDSLPIEIVGAFLRMFNVDLAATGCVSAKLLCAHNLDQLVAIADDLQVPESDALCDAYEDGQEAFAKAIIVALGANGLDGYVPPTLRP